MKTYEMVVSYLQTGTIQVEAKNEEDALIVFDEMDMSDEPMSIGDWETHDIWEVEE